MTDLAFILCIAVFCATLGFVFGVFCGEYWEDQRWRKTARWLNDA